MSTGTRMKGADNERVVPPAMVREGDHLIAAYAEAAHGPTLIAIGSIHGNEPSGTRALARVADTLRTYRGDLNGRLYLVAGNTRALAEGKRFIDADLNRYWTNAHVGSSTPQDAVAEDLELRELQTLLDHILVTARDEVYVLDLHSTSASGKPFATVGDTLRNRSFAQKFNVTFLLGIEEQLEGTMLEFFNNLGAVTLGFEGGQHESEDAVANHEALVMAALKHAGIINCEPLTGPFEEHLSRAAGGRRIYEVRYRHPVRDGDKFVMTPGFNNFDTVRKADVLAHDEYGPVTSPETGVIMMPLYQKLGEDGFFLARRVKRFWLAVSWLLRKTRIPALAPLLPGVSRDPKDPYTVIVDTRIARLVPLQIFHLLGFRKRRWSAQKLVVSRRRHDTVSPFR